MKISPIVMLSCLVSAAFWPAPCTARTYTSTFPLAENPISEDHQWINGKTDGLDWADIRTTPGLAFGTESGSIKYDDSTALLTGSWGPDQTVQATVYSVNPQTDAAIWEEVEIRLRSSISAHRNTGYEILFELPPHNFCQVVRWNGPLGDWTSLGYLGSGVHSGDEVKASIVGNVITVYVNGVSRGQVIDSTYTSGSPGMGFYLEGTTGVNRDYGFTSFTATDGLPSSLASAIPTIASVTGAIPIKVNATATALVFPGPDPGEAKAQVQGDRWRIGNRALSVAWSINQTKLKPVEVHSELTTQAMSLTGEAFEIVLADSTRYRASEMIVDGKPAITELAVDAKSFRAADRIPGCQIVVLLHSTDGKLRVIWRAQMHDGSNYVRQEIEITPTEIDLAIREVIMFNQFLPEAKTAGQTDGSPVTVGQYFLGIEDPMAVNSVNTSGRGDSVLCRFPRNSILKRGESLTQSFVLGVSPAGQMRRGFLYYLERQRAHPYRPYLHYNSWYDTAWDPFALNEANCLEAIRLCGERLIRRHGVTMDGMVFDDGWDDPQTLWQFHSGFPRGFAPLAEACREYNTRLGVWLSPFGGYGESKERRLRFGRQQDYEINDAGFSLAGPKYYAAFKTACIDMIRKYGVNHFKFDGIATGMYASGGAQYILDTEALRRLMLELRQENPDLYVNFTTGSWPSPFWLRYADSLWRQGGDMGLSGKGPRQQQWLTYRDQETYRNVVRKGPLYPLNSLMTQGVAYSRHGSAGDSTFNSAGFKDDVRAFFGSGTGLQELYIQPGKLTDDDWSVLAEAAKWSRANADVLVDTHWIGGDPGNLEVYGFASWNPRKGVVMLRNPDDQPHSYVLDIGAAFELPAGAPTQYSLRSPWDEDASKPALITEVGKTISIALKPFEVVVLTATPAR